VPRRARRTFFAATATSLAAFAVYGIVGIATQYVSARSAMLVFAVLAAAAVLVRTPGAALGTLTRQSRSGPFEMIKRFLSNGRGVTLFGR
jgi:hypothetical protein